MVTWSHGAIEMFYYYYLCHAISPKEHVACYNYKIFDKNHEQHLIKEYTNNNGPDTFKDL